MFLYINTNMGICFYGFLQHERFLFLFDESRKLIQSLHNMNNVYKKKT